jgi:MFS family permease
MESKPETTVVEDSEHMPHHESHGVAAFFHPGDSGTADKAYEIYKGASGPVVVTEENNNRVKRKIDLALLPIMLFAYVLQQLDKSTLSYASVFGIQQKAHLHGRQYSWLSSAVYFAQLVIQPFAAYFLVRFPVAKFLAVNVFCWGAVLCCMAAATNFGGLLTTRIFLGVFEAVIAPTFVAITQLWWRRAEQANRTAAWYSMNGVAFMFGSLLSYGLGHIHSHLASYQIIFLFTGCITVAFSFVILFFLPDSPLTARFLNDEDRLIAIERLRFNQMGVETKVWKWDQVRECALDPKTYLWAILLFSISIPSGGISNFGPLIIESFGFNNFQTILLNIPYGAVQIIAILGSALVSTRLRLKAPVLIFLCLVPIAGCAMLLTIPHNKDNKGALLAAYYIAAFYTGISPLLYSWAAQNTAGDTKKKCTTAALFMGQSTGNIVGPLLYTTAEAPLYQTGLRADLAMFCILILFIVVGCLWLWKLNKDHAKRCIEMGKAPPARDLSMVSGKWFATNADEIPTQSEIDNGLRDMTDKKNEDFIYVF